MQEAASPHSFGIHSWAVAPDHFDLQGVLGNTDAAGLTFLDVESLLALEDVQLVSQLHEVGGVGVLGHGRS